jgi:hypothetical protein
VSSRRKLQIELCPPIQGYQSKIGWMFFHRLAGCKVERPKVLSFLPMKQIGKTDFTFSQFQGDDCRAEVGTLG